jgi:N-acetylglucosaminyldiphosphoundecaprenol N-acetyl-beta-D-mannosaminyltransferase
MSQHLGGAPLPVGGEAIGEIRLFHIPIHPLDAPSAAALIVSWLERRDRPCRMVVTPNVNHAVLYRDDAAFRKAYAAASLRLADGRYLPLAARLLGRGRLPTVNGSDLVPAVLEAGASIGGLKVFLLGAAPGIAERAGREIERHHPSIRVVGTHSPPIGFEARPADSARIVELVSAARPELLIVGISPPRQEIWTANHLGRLDASVVVCAGATIDFLAGNKPRAPLWMQRSGMEWLHRVITEPARLAPRYARDALQLGRMLYNEWRSAGRSQ